MKYEYSDEIARSAIGPLDDVVKPFVLKEYLNNGPLIRKLHEEKVVIQAEVLDLRKHRDELNHGMQGLESRCTDLTSQLRITGSSS